MRNVTAALWPRLLLVASVAFVLAVLAYSIHSLGRWASMWLALAFLAQAFLALGFLRQFPPLLS
jgi:hypothetical protein